MTDKAWRVHSQFSQTKDNAIIIHIKNGTKAKLYNQNVMHHSQFCLTSTSNVSTSTQVFQALILIASINFNRYHFMQCPSRHRAMHRTGGQSNSSITLQNSSLHGEPAPGHCRAAQRMASRLHRLLPLVSERWNLFTSLLGYQTSF